MLVIGLLGNRHMGMHPTSSHLQLGRAFGDCDRAKSRGKTVLLVAGSDCSSVIPDDKSNRTNVISGHTHTHPPPR